MSIIFVLINLALLPIFVSILKRFPLWASFTFFFVVILEGVFLAFYTLINFGGAFGPGNLLSCFSTIFIPIIFLAWIIVGIRQFPELNNPQRSVFAIGGIVIIFAQSAPVIGDYGLGGYCDEKRMEYGNNIVTKIEQYHNANGKYPSEIERLIPEYWPNQPVFNCMENLRLNNDSLIAHYGIMECEGQPSLVTHSTDGTKDMWYNFKTANWSSRSFFDSDCY